jgi:hypothetical protein
MVGDYPVATAPVALSLLFVQPTVLSILLGPHTTLKPMADPNAPQKSPLSLLAIIAAIASFVVHSGILGLLLAIVAIVLGAIGFFIAFIPRSRGGIISLMAMVLGAFGIIAGVVRALWHFAGHL